MTPEQVALLWIEWWGSLSGWVFVALYAGLTGRGWSKTPIGRNLMALSVADALFFTMALIAALAGRAARWYVDVFLVAMALLPFTTTWRIVIAVKLWRSTIAEWWRRTQMNVAKIAKALVAGVTAGYGVFEATTSTGGSMARAALLGGIAAVVTGVITWGVPNAVEAELTAVAGTIETALTPTQHVTNVYTSPHADEPSATYPPPAGA
jgi:hypothetical protein